MSLAEYYAPKACGGNADTAARIEAEGLAQSLRFGITQEIVREPMPNGHGFGFRWKFYRDGIEIPNGQQGLAEIMQQPFKQL